MRQTRCLAHLDPAFEQMDYCCDACHKLVIQDIFEAERMKAAVEHQIYIEDHPPNSEAN